MYILAAVLCISYLPKTLSTRKPENRCGNMVQTEKIALIHFCLTLRSKLQEFFISAPTAILENLTDNQHCLLQTIWKQIFLEPFSALMLYWKPKQQASNSIKEFCKTNGCRGLMIASMYEPFNAEEYVTSSEKLILSSIPYGFKTIIICWMLNTPYFHGNELHRLKLLRYVPELCAALTKHPQIINSRFFFTFVQEVMTGLWRASYIGGNNLKALVAFGDFITFVMTKSIPYPKPEPTKKHLVSGEKLRIGYISRNFYKQAVSCYMVNRVIYHDPAKFEIFTFAIGEWHDEVSSLFESHSEHFHRFTNVTDLRSISQKLYDCKLDILIYADIGMDPITYMLSGLQLAPLQCALVGHGTTTGMPNIQYYLSGDFEAPDAQRQYREKLIRLPRLGAAQYMPIEKEYWITRKDLGVPEDAVVFISCANGIKHGEGRDQLLIDILKQAPNAWILLKPYAHHSSIDPAFHERIVKAAKEANVAERLLILPPIATATHVLGLLALADVQLDTFPYGGWTTNLEALYMGLPVVTQEGELSRSRWGSGMLRLLGITEGIAENEVQYVEQAVNYAQNKQLIKANKQKILETAFSLLFNGAAAQADYEAMLVKIYEADHFSTENSTIKFNSLIQPITIATSLSLHNITVQKTAMYSWQNAGFQIVSINTLEEVVELKPHFSAINFVVTYNHSSQQYGKNHIYFDDILYFAKLQ